MLVKSWSACSLLASLSLLLSGCGYRWQPDYPMGRRPTVVVPFIPGDQDGTFTNEVARALGQSGLVDVSHKEADYRLEISIANASTETIGYRFAKEKISGEVSKNLVASEGRKSLKIVATLLEGKSEKIAYGPYEIQADADYDYLAGDSFQDLTFVNQMGMTTTVLPFSLGQLEPNEAAQEAATRPLYVFLARKIVDALTSEW